MIKQARPWANYKLSKYAFSNPEDYLDLFIFPNPANDFITIQCDDCKITTLRFTNKLGQTVLTKSIPEENVYGQQIYVGDLTSGMYFVSAYKANGQFYSATRILKK